MLFGKKGWRDYVGEHESNTGALPLMSPSWSSPEHVLRGRDAPMPDENHWPLRYSSSPHPKALPTPPHALSLPLPPTMRGSTRAMQGDDGLPLALRRRERPPFPRLPIQAHRSYFHADQ